MKLQIFVTLAFSIVLHDAKPNSHEYHPPAFMNGRPREGFVGEPYTGNTEVDAAEHLSKTYKRVNRSAEKRPYKPPAFLNGRPTKGGFLGTPYMAEDAAFRCAKAEWFDQRLTHFDDGDTRRWKQKFYVNDTHFKGNANSPVFLMIGGEGALSAKWVAVGEMPDLAKQHGALMVALEHRFYGESHPTPDTSTGNLGYLNSEQALADLAAFREAMVERFGLSDGNKWISFGGSYPGALSAWFRSKYPHLVYGAIASSAPIQAQLDFPQYLEVSTNAISTTSMQCAVGVSEANKMIEKLVTTQDGLNVLSRMFNTCEPLMMNNKLDIYNFASSAAGNFFGIIQYNKDNRMGGSSSKPQTTIDTLCDIMNYQHGSALERYAEVNAFMQKKQGSECLDASYAKMINFLKDTSFASEAAEGGRQWLYQTCTEFGYYQTTDSKEQVFGSLFDLDFSVQQCEDIFGLQFNSTNIQAGIDQTNANYGGYKMKGTRIVFPNGSIDPWHALSFIHDPTDDIKTIYIHGTAHCANMYPASPKDPEELTQAREEIGKIIGQWLVEEE